MIKLLNEDIESIKKYYPNIPDDVFYELIKLDPTYRGNNSLGKYGKWILNLYNKGSISEQDFSEITPLLQQFTTYRNRIQEKDLNKYKSLDELAEILASVVNDDSMLTARQKVRFLKNVKAGRVKIAEEDDYDIVLDTPKYTVYVPNTHEASMKLGKGTRWCTAHENPEWYNYYTKDGGKLYIVRNKQTGDRWQYSDTSEDFLDQDDGDFDIVELMKTDKDLSKFFEKFLGIDFYSFDGTWFYDGGRIPSDMRKLIEKVIINNNIITIKQDAFIDCVNLKNVALPDDLVRIESGAFYGCKNLVKIVIPNSVTTIGARAFMECESLQNIYIPESVTVIGADAFYGTEWLAIKEKENPLVVVNGILIDGFNCKGDITIPSYVTQIGSNAFYLCSNVTSINISDGVRTIGSSAFSYSERLTSVRIPNSVKNIDGALNIFYCVFGVTVYTDSEYVIQYCNRYKILVKPLKDFKTESIHRTLKLRIRED